jgi:O-antigen/teichoic acid export membrane protein
VPDETPGEAVSGEAPETIAGGSAPLLWAQIAGNAGLFVGVALISRALGPEGRGTVAFITVTAIVSGTVARFGVTDATTVFCAQRPRVRAVLMTNLLVSVGVAAVVAAAVVCGTLEFVPRLRPLGIGDPELAALAMAMVASGLADAGYMFVLGCSRFRFHATVTIVTAWCYAAAIGGVDLAWGLTPLAAALVWVGSQAVKAAVLIGASVRAEGLGRFDPRLLRESVSFGLRAWIGTLATAFNERLDQIFVALLASEAVLGMYAVAVNAFEILLYPAGAAATAILPLAARAAGRDRGGRVLGAFRSVAMLTVAGIVVAALLGPPLIPLAFGSAFEPSADPFLWLLPGSLGFVALAIFSNALVASSAPGRSSAGPLVSLVLGIVLDVILIPRYGATGAAVAASAGLLAGGAVSLALFRRHTPFPARALLVPQRTDVELLRAMARPFARPRPDSST